MYANANTNTYIYIHVCCINNWKDIFNKIVLDIKLSGLYNKIIKIRCNILTESNEDLLFFIDDKIEIIGSSNNLNLFENSTINLLHEHALLEDFNVLYMHTKGVKHNNSNINVTDWVEYLSYFNIYKYNTCINELVNYDAIGVNLQKHDDAPLHYSGNFWWSKSEYIRKLDKCKYINYNSPEFWLTENSVGNYLSLWNSNTHHYKDRYEKHNYINKECKYLSYNKPMSYPNFDMKIKYGLPDNNIDVTIKCLSLLTSNNIITIPIDDCVRANFFTDPLPGILKSIFILHNNILTQYEHNYTVKINIVDNKIITLTDNYIYNKLINIHSKIKLNHGSITDELPEQHMTVRYLTGNEKILEIGGNIGRNSLVIANILQNNNNNNNNNNFVVLESDENIAIQLYENRNLNNYNFHIESSALSKRKLIQKDWNTIESDIILDGYKSVNTITLEQLYVKYNIKFDTLVLDCEGAFYYILIDMPEILNNIKLIIMENDYNDVSRKQYVDEILTKNNFCIDYVNGKGWSKQCEHFFEVWIKMD